MQLQRSIHPDNWDNQRSRASGRSNEANEFNRYIDSVLTRARQKYSELITMHETVTPQLLRDAILGVNTAKARMIVEIWEDHIAGLRKLIGKESTFATCQKYTAAKNHFQTFLKQRYKVANVPIKTIDNNMVTEFGLHLKTEKGCNYNTANKFLQNLKRITYRCLCYGWIIKDPCAGISLKMKEVDRPHLTEDELNSTMCNTP
jgi:hypothetical protein